MNFLELAEQVIRQVNQPLTPTEIWEAAVERGLDKQLNSRGRTPWATLGSRLYVDIRDNEQSKFEAIGKRPTKFGLKNITPNTSDSSQPTVPISEPERYNERDLHPLLVKFADSYHHFRGAKLKTIFHEKSSKAKKGANKWLHPDLVGAYFSFNDKIRQYEKVIINFQNDFGSLTIFVELRR